MRHPYTITAEIDGETRFFSGFAFTIGSAPVACWTQALADAEPFGSDERARETLAKIEPPPLNPVVVKQKPIRDMRCC